MKILIGQLARNEQDVVGIVLRNSKLTGLYTGVDFDGMYWESMAPMFVSHSINEYWTMYQDQK